MFFEDRKMKLSNVLEAYKLITIAKENHSIEQMAEVSVNVIQLCK